MRRSADGSRNQRRRRTGLADRHRRDDLRLLRGARRKGPEEGAGRDRRQRQSGHRIGACPDCGGVDPRDALRGNRRRRLRGQLAECRTRNRQRTHAAGTGAAARANPSDHRRCAQPAAAVADAGAALRRALDAAGLAAVGVGDTGAVLARRAFLPRRLGCAEGAQRQHGPAGGDRHLGRLWAQRVPPVAGGDPPGRGAVVFRGLRGGDHADPAGQVARRPCPPADHRCDPRIAGAASGDRAGDPRWRRGRAADRRIW